MESRGCVDIKEELKFRGCKAIPNSSVSLQVFSAESMLLLYKGLEVADRKLLGIYIRHMLPAIDAVDFMTDVGYKSLVLTVSDEERNIIIGGRSEIRELLEKLETFKENRNFEELATAIERIRDYAILMLSTFCMEGWEAYYQDEERTKIISSKRERGITMPIVYPRPPKEKPRPKSVKEAEKEEAKRILENKIASWDIPGWLYDGYLTCRMDEIILIRDINGEKIEVTLRNGQTLYLHMPIEVVIKQMEDR